ncbi:MAG: prenyltransferase/squalene oxidase repeat-containing protein [Verrucomicrobiota bacterium]
MNLCRTFFAIVCVGILAGCASRDLPVDTAVVAERKGVWFLSKEVPAWYKDNGCFSCHNNGDAARALYLASQKGYEIPAAVLASTTDWVTRPQTWDDNKGDPGFSDKRLADVQFALALLTAIDTGHTRKTESLVEAVKRVLSQQAADGSWPIDAKNTLGSPATYGAPLATHAAIKILKRSDSAEAKAAVTKAEQWLRTVPVNSVFNAAVLSIALKDDTSERAKGIHQKAFQLIQLSQTNDGGWGPYADAPPEVFDTAMVLLALAPLREGPETALMIERGRNYLAANQYDDGSWPETTRPSGNESYAQRLSTTGWAVMALLATRND